MRDPFEISTSLQSGSSSRSLEWEESAVDSQSYVEGFHDEERTVPSLGWLKLLMLAVFVVVGVRLFDLQIVKGSYFRLLSEDNRIREQVVLAPRGLIRDRNGEVLAQNTASFNLVAVPFDLPKEGLEDQVNKLCQMMGLDRRDVDDILVKVNRRSFEPVVIKQDITQEQSILFETRAQEFIGFSVLKNPIREYLEPQIFSHILGYTGIVSDDDLKRVSRDLYATNDYIGKLGIESQYENYLHGQNGQNQVEVDATGRVLKTLGEHAPNPGDVLILNIDKGLQEQLYNAFEPGSRGAAVALNPRTGEVLALVSVPGFDNNQFAHGIKKEDYQKFLDDKALPLFNRAVAGTYPPGSTAKLMVAAAGLQEGVIDENTVIRDNGVLSIPNQYNNGITYLFRGWKPSGLGPMNVRSAIAMSSDIFFYEVAGGSPNGSIEGLGVEKLAEYFRKFSLGKLTGIDLGGEKPGVVPDPEWKMKYFKDPLLGKWYLGDTYHMGIGQGDVLVTPLQVALWTAVIANDGVGYKPHIAGKAIDANGKTVWENKPEVIVSDIASRENIKIVQEGMRETVLNGTAHLLSSLPISSAGKTGTSQFDGSDPTRTHAWFTSYAPFEDPQIVVTVLVEAGGEGHSVAEPIAKNALQWWVENRYKK